MASDIRPRVVTRRTVVALLGRHHCFRDTDVLPQVVAPLVRAFAYASRLEDVVRRVRPAFREWCRATSFHPKPTHRAQDHCDDEVVGILSDLVPVHEYLRFGGHIFYRRRHSAGVSFVARMPWDGRDVCVVWTTRRKAHVFARRKDAVWEVVKTLHRQDDPVATWMRFLGGSRVCERERQNAAANEGTQTDKPVFSRHGDACRSPRQLFHDLVVPCYGSVEWCRKRASCGCGDVTMWQTVRSASLMTVAADHPSRFEWYALSAVEPSERTPRL